MITAATMMTTCSSLTWAPKMVNSVLVLVKYVGNWLLPSRLNSFADQLDEEERGADGADQERQLRCAASSQRPVGHPLERPGDDCADDRAGDEARER